MFFGLSAVFFQVLISVNWNTLLVLPMALWNGDVPDKKCSYRSEFSCTTVVFLSISHTHTHKTHKADAKLTIMLLKPLLYSFRKREAKKCMKGKEIWFESVVTGKGRWCHIEWLPRKNMESINLLTHCFNTFFVIDVNVSSSHGAEA